MMPLLLAILLQGVTSSDANGNNAIFPLPSKARSGPEFLSPVPNTTVAVGRDAVIPCVVRNLHDYKVRWLAI